MTVADFEKSCFETKVSKGKCCDHSSRIVCKVNILCVKVQFQFYLGQFVQWHDVRKYREKKSSEKNIKYMHGKKFNKQCTVLCLNRKKSL